VLPTLPEQQEREAARAKAGQDITAFLLHIRSLKREAKAARREVERKNALQVRVCTPARLHLSCLCNKLHAMGCV
jgi:hypothetical protein